MALGSAPISACGKVTPTCTLNLLSETPQGYTKECSSEQYHLEVNRIPSILGCYLRCPSSPHAALGGRFLSLPTASLRLNSDPYAPRQAAALSTLRTHYLVVLLEALLREDATRHRVRLTFP